MQTTKAICKFRIIEMYLSSCIHTHTYIYIYIIYNYLYIYTDIATTVDCMKTILGVGLCCALRGAADASSAGVGDITGPKSHGLTTKPNNHIELGKIIQS